MSRHTATTLLGIVALVVFTWLYVHFAGWGPVDGVETPSLPSHVP